MSASLPVSDSSLSFWHQTTRSFPHLNNNRDVPVPSTSRYAVIGSGVSGALTAWELIKRVKGEDILILEAREAVSGATGRNAGHVRPGITPVPTRFGAFPLLQSGTVRRKRKKSSKASESSYRQ
ncbi:unnamed protein product [Clonostachys chloroleuca]|uniref:FAD dependent oxidoreductase domain-containing protein n=1 Tax=Clonostachys chloroleuca TaxID=1926264 RepID=A0AA35Q8A2_9HYPO|nr:unnamed protein product [Clonostachys chloroleuca]